MPGGRFVRQPGPVHVGAHVRQHRPPRAERGATQSTTCGRSACVGCGPWRRKQPTTQVSTPARSASAASSSAHDIGRIAETADTQAERLSRSRGPASNSRTGMPAVTIVSPAATSRATSAGRKNPGGSHGRNA